MPNERQHTHVLLTPPSPDGVPLLTELPGPVSSGNALLARSSWHESGFGRGNAPR